MSKSSARAAEKQTFSNASTPSRCAATSGTVRPRPFGYCSVTITGTPSARAPSIRTPALLATLSKSTTAGLKPSCTSTTTSAARSRSSIRAGIRSDGPDRERPLAVRNVTARDGHADPTGQALPGERAVGGAALVAGLAHLPLRLRVDEADVRLGAGSERRRGDPERVPAGGHPHHQRGKVDEPGQHQSRVERREGG